LRKKIGECLIQAGLITEEDLGVALTEHKRTGERLGVVLVRMNLATEKQIAKALAFQLGFPYINLSENPPDAGAVTLIPKDVALKRVCVAVRLEKNLLTVAMSDPLLFSLVQDLEFQTGYRIKQVVATRGDITEAIQTGYPDKALMRATPESRSELALREREATRRGAFGTGSCNSDGCFTDGDCAVKLHVPSVGSNPLPVIVPENVRVTPMSAASARLRCR
jgi:type IV pilus assembly protein PilB